MEMDNKVRLVPLQGAMRAPSNVRSGPDRTPLVPLRRTPRITYTRPWEMETRQQLVPLSWVMRARARRLGRHALHRVGTPPRVDEDSTAAEAIGRLILLVPLPGAMTAAALRWAKFVALPLVPLPGAMTALIKQFNLAPQFMLVPLPGPMRAPRLPRRRPQRTEVGTPPRGDESLTSAARTGAMSDVLVPLPGAMTARGAPWARGGDRAVGTPPRGDEGVTTTPLHHRVTLLVPPPPGAMTAGPGLGGHGAPQRVGTPPRGEEDYRVSARYAPLDVRLVPLPGSMRTGEAGDGEAEFFLLVPLPGAKRAGGDVQLSHRDLRVGTPPRGDGSFSPAVPGDSMACWYPSPGR
ncbi:hypothetical protein GZL_02518 [Streptomyces sp. 769]|nr:hypothetical protein GZL_02518 [Streptomyces sp. 769]